MKVLFVTRDKKPGMIAVKIAEELWCNGIEISIVAEGLSVAEWKKAGLDDGIIAEGPLDIKAPWDISPKDVFYDVQPDVVVCGLSSPIRSEAWFAVGARNPECSSGVPLVVLDDNWGATYQCPVQADLVLTIDQLGARLVEGNPMYKGHEYRVEIIGDLSATAANEPVSQATIDAFNTAKGDAEYAFLLCSQKWLESEDIMTIALGSCARSLDAGAKLVVIPRFHPGAKDGDRAFWSGRMSEFGDRYHGVVQEIIDTPELTHSTDHLATLADGVFAATGSALRAAAYAGKISFCVWSQQIAKKLLFECGIERHPLIAATVAGCCEMRAPSDVVSLVRMLCRDTQPKQHLLAPVPFDAVKAANAILAIAKK